MSDTKAAYRLIDTDGDCEIRFLTAAAASKLAEDLYEVERCEEFDDLVEQGRVTPADYLARGYVLYCMDLECGKPFTAYGPIDEDETEQAIGPAVCEETMCFCSARCKRRHEARVERIRSRRAAAEQRMDRERPYVKLVEWSTGGCRMCDCFSGDHENQHARVQFEGAKVLANDYCDGCRKIWICKGDAEAWRRLTQR